MIYVGIYKIQCLIGNVLWVPKEIFDVTLWAEMVIQQNTQLGTMKIL